MKSPFMKEVLVLVCDYEKDGTPILMVVNNVNQIDDQYDGDTVVIYTLNRKAKFTVKKGLE